MGGNILILILILCDIAILVILVGFYMKFKKLLNLPIEEIEEALERAHQLVEKLKELKKIDTQAKSTLKNPKEEVFQLYQKGLKIREIAKQTGLSEGEVELLLKTKKLS